MKVVVEDANVLLDLVNSEVLGLWLGCNYEHLTTHLVRDEIKDEKQQGHLQLLIDAGKLTLCNIAPEAWSEIYEFSAANRVSITDACVWSVAKKEGAILLTGDSKLKKAAQATDVQVHGVLWVLQKLVELKQITTSRACEALDAMAAGNAFLPRDECNKLKAGWKSSK